MEQNRKALLAWGTQLEDTATRVSSGARGECDAMRNGGGQRRRCGPALSGASVRLPCCVTLRLASPGPDAIAVRGRVGFLDRRGRGAPRKRRDGLTRATAFRCTGELPRNHVPFTAPSGIFPDTRRPSRPAFPPAPRSAA